MVPIQSILIAAISHAAQPAAAARAVRSIFIGALHCGKDRKCISKHASKRACRCGDDMLCNKYYARIPRNMWAGRKDKDPRNLMQRARRGQVLSRPSICGFSLLSQVNCHHNGFTFRNPILRQDLCRASGHSICGEGSHVLLLIITGPGVHRGFRVRHA